MDFEKSFATTFKKWKRPKKTDNRGNIEGLAKYISHRVGNDPHLWTKCMAFDKLQGYDHEARAAICARVHKIATGYWPAEKKPEGWKPENQFTKTKGGQGSGNWGHQGLSGVHGGSAPTKNAKSDIGWHFTPAETALHSPSSARNVYKKVLGANIKPLDNKYLRSDEARPVDIEQYYKDNPNGAILFEVPPPHFGYTPQYLLITKNPSDNVEKWRNHYEWKYRSTALFPNGEPFGHYAPALRPFERKTFDLALFEEKFYEFFVDDDPFNTYPDVIQPVGEIVGESAKELLENIAIKGGQGSGNWGHEGLPGVWGGSRSGTSSANGSISFEADKYKKMSIPERKKAFFSQSQHAVDAQAQASSSIPQYISEKLSAVGERPNTGDLRADILTRVDQYGDLSLEANKNMITDTALELESILTGLGVEDDLRRKIVMDACDALIVQDNESLAHQLGDHGIHHIRGNITTAYEILKVVPGEDTLETVAEVYLAHIYHDTGYLTEPSRMFLDDAHPRWSRQNYDRNVKLDVAQALGKESAENISHLIESHAGTTIDWNGDPVGSAVRVSDNLALFHDEKLPQLFRSVPQNLNILEQLQLGNLTESQANSKMIANINSLDFSPEVRSQLIKAARECNRLTPKFTLGMMGGNIDGFDWQGGHLRVYLRKNSEATRLQKILDLGQKQFAKFAKTYGVDWKTFRGNIGFKFPPEGETLLESVVVGQKEKQALLKMIRGILDAQD